MDIYSFFFSAHFTAPSMPSRWIVARLDNRNYEQSIEYCDNSLAASIHAIKTFVFFAAEWIIETLLSFSPRVFSHCFVFAARKFASLKHHNMLLSNTQTRYIAGNWSKWPKFSIFQRIIHCIGSIQQCSRFSLDFLNVFKYPHI